MKRKYTDEDLLAIMQEHPIWTMADLARHFEVSETSISSRTRKFVRKGWSPIHNYTHVVPEGFLVKGVSQQYKADGTLGQQWVKSAIDRERQAEMMQQTIDSFAAEIPKVSKTIVYEEHNLIQSLMAVLPIGDPHIGMLAWEAECGASWDLKIAQDTFCKLFDSLIDAAPRCHKVVIENLGDLLHYDNIMGVTARSGHHLDTDGRYAKMVDVVIIILRFIITKCLQHFGSVHIINAIGNHDDVGAIWISRLLAVAYEDEPRVTVDTNPSPCSYVRFGSTLIGVHHGHTIKMAKLPGVMATDKRKDWGDTDFQYWHTGHIHHDSTFIAQEFPSCKVESFRTLAPKDSYATWGGWRSGQDSKCIIFHEKFGEVSRITKNIAEVLE